MKRLTFDKLFSRMLSLWGSQKKKPLCSIPAAHGKEDSNHQANWVTAVAALANTDLIASGKPKLLLNSNTKYYIRSVSAGSRDGYIRLWKCGDNFRSLIPLMTVPARGFVNSLAFSSDGKMLIAGLGQEHRLGRWWRDATAKNEILVIPLHQHTAS